MPLSTGMIINQRYRIVNLLGQGGFGAVYKAWDLNLSRPCALKENLDASAEAQKQFNREAVILANLIHPHLARVIDYFSIPDQGQYLVMDYVEGNDLQEIIDQKGPQPEVQVTEWIGQICDALAYLHRQKPPIIHRDIKPANIKIDPEGKAVLVDFGVAKVWDPSLRTTQGARAITPGFSPFEQYGQAPTDARTDIYALGATAYCLLTGQPPTESIARMAGAPLKPIRDLQPEISASFAQVIQRALAVMPEDRFQTALEFRQALSTPVTGPMPVMEKDVKPSAVSPTARVVSPPYHPTPDVLSVAAPAYPQSGKKIRKTSAIPIILGSLFVLAIIIGGVILASSLIKKNLATPETVLMDTTEELKATEVSTEISTAIPTEAATEVVETGPVTLTIWVDEANDPNISESLQTLIIDYQLNHPDTTIEIVAIPASVVLPWIQTTMATGDIPSAILGTNQMAYTLFLDGSIQPMEKLYNTREYLPQAVEGLTYEGSVWGLPLTVQGYLLLYYNKVFISTPPTYTDELIALVKENYANNAKTGLVYTNTASYWLAPWYYGYQGRFLKGIGSTAQLENEPLIKALELTLDLNPGLTWIDYVTAERYFVNQEAAIIINGGWAYETYKSAIGGNLGVAPIPIISGTNITPPSPMSLFTFVIPSTIDGLERKATLDFMKYVTETESFLTGETNWGVMPAQIQLLNKVWMSGEPRNVMGDVVFNGLVSPSSPEMGCIWTGTDTVMGNWDEGVTADEMAKLAQDEVGACLELLK